MSGSMAPEPEDILWENLEVSNDQRATKQLQTYALTTLLLYASSVISVERKIVPASGARAFVLFTSHAALRRCAYWYAEARVARQKRDKSAGALCKIQERDFPCLISRSWRRVQLVSPPTPLSLRWHGFVFYEY